MSKSNPGKHGFPVLAYLTSEPLTLSCTLRIQHHEPRKQVTLMLRTSVSLHSAASQAFVAQYDADKLLPASEATVYVPEHRRSEIARNPSSSQMTTLSLQLSQPCVLWCPRVDGLVPAPEPAHVEAFNELVLLAKATTVHVVFDYHWLSLDARVPFQRLVKGKEALTGFPVHEYYARFYQRADWTIFGPPELKAEASTAKVTNSRDASNKRAWRASSPLLSPPPYKRKIVDPEYAPSPTEVATSPAIVKSIEDEYRRGRDTDKSIDDEHDFQTRAISLVVQRHLPAVLADILPTALRQTLPELLPALLPSLLALPASFTTSYDSSSFDGSTSQPSSPPESQSLPPYNLRPSDLTPLGASLLPHLLAHLTPQLGKMHSRSLARGVYHWQKTAALELHEDAEDHKAVLAQIRDDGVGELHREAGYALDQVREQGREVAEDVGDEVEQEIRRRVETAVRDVRRAIQNGVRETERRGGSDLHRRRGRRVGKGGFRGIGDRGAPVA